MKLRLLHLTLFEKGNIIISNHQLSIVIEISMGLGKH